MTLYQLQHKGKVYSHEGYITHWDAIYFKVLPQEPDGINKIGPYEFSWRPMDGVWSGPNLELLIRDTNSNKVWKTSIYYRVKKRKNELGDSVKYHVYEVYKSSIKGDLKEDWDRVDQDIQNFKAEAKREWDRTQALKRKAELKELLKVTGQTEEELRAEKAAQRKLARQKRTVGSSVERTNRILKLAPLMSDIRDEIDVILKQYNEGGGNVSRPVNKLQKLRDFKHQLKFFKS